MAYSLEDFVRESNRIEGIHRQPVVKEIMAHERLLAQKSLDIFEIERFVATVAPGKPLRAYQGMNVFVGEHIPIAGGIAVPMLLETILKDVNENTIPPYVAHHRYETLHPFMDGNGRSGRAIWLWHMGGIAKAPLGFLHHWYYQSLRETRA